MWHFWAQNGPFNLNKKFLVQTIIITFIYLLDLFTVQIFKKILTADLELWGCAIFGPKMVHLSKTKTFSEKIINIIFIYLLVLFIVQNLKKNSYSQSRVMRMHYLNRRMHYLKLFKFAQTRIFFRKPVNKSCSFHSCLSIWQKSKSDINLLMKNWPLKNTEISLAESCFWL